MVIPILQDARIFFSMHWNLDRLEGTESWKRKMIGGKQQPVLKQVKTRVESE